MKTETFIIQSDDEIMRLDKMLTRRFEVLSRETAQELIRKGLVMLNGQKPKVNRIPIVGDQIEIQIPENTDEAHILPQDIALDILYEDEHLLVINKPAGLIIHPGFGNPNNTLVNGLFSQYPAQMLKFEEPTRAGIVHRLDKDTSGVLLVALNTETRDALMAQFKERTVKKIYWGLVDGAPPTEFGRIDAPIGRSIKNRSRMQVRPDGKSSQTNFKGLEAFIDHTLLEVHIETGRTHQIRVHLAYIGCPIAGDKTYGKSESTITLDRFFLHARQLTFTHPVKQEVMTVTAPLAPELQQVLDELTQERDQW